MLTHLDIRNFTIIPTLSLEFSSGMTVLTGETGAGKSIILNALSLALGARAKKNLVRDTNNPAEITLSFHIKEDSSAYLWLQENNFDDDNQCLIRRIIHADGRTRNTINGKPSAQSMTRALAEHLIHIHSQHQQQQLLKTAWQGECLDQYGSQQNLLQKTHDLSAQWQAIRDKIEQCESNKQNHGHELALIQYQHDELCELAPQQGEWEQLSEQHETLHQAQTITDQINNALQVCRDNEQSNALDNLQKAAEEISQLPVKNKVTKNIEQLLKSATIHCQEACDELAQYTQTLNSHSSELQTIESRLSKLDTVARKHQAKPNELPKQLDLLAKKLQQLSNIDEHVAQLNVEAEQIMAKYQAAAKSLSKKREAAAKKLQKIVTEQIQALNMPGSTFNIILNKRDSQPHSLGAETINFLLSTQPNTPPQPLAEIASGGELSRITLTLMLAAAQSTQMPIFIFDEIDVGMGGQTAKLVGKRVQDLSKSTQVFCITHLPQVAALGDHHFRVDKALNDDDVTSKIEQLSPDARITELARMTSGDEISDAALAHASTLVD